jgi:hypothetical protein
VTTTERVPRGFAETNLYLVPAGQWEALQPRLVSQRVTGYLESRGILGGVYDAELGWLSPGEHARELFSESVDHPGFEYLIVYEHGVAQFVPNAHTGRFGIHCKACGASQDEALHALLLDPDANVEAGTRLACEACGASQPLSGLHGKVEMAMTCFYLNFCNVSSTRLAPDILRDLEARVGAGLRLIVERL